MHRLAPWLGAAVFLVGVASALLAWWNEGLDLLRLWARSYRPESDGTVLVWLGLGDALFDRSRQMMPLALPVVSVTGIGVVQGMDWRLGQRMRGHHAHLLSYGWGLCWATGGLIVSIILRPQAICYPRWRR